MDVYLPVFGPIQAFEFIRKVGCRRIEIVDRPRVVRKIVMHRLFQQLVLEKVRLVEKEDDGGRFEPRQAHDGFEQ